ncbi:MAG: hypothetical protein ACRBN8_42695 [Nannocystales bacterium]
MHAYPTGIAASPGDRVATVWTQGTTSVQQVLVRELSEGTWSKTVRLDSEQHGTYAEDATLGWLSAEHAIAAWWQHGEQGGRIMTATRPTDRETWTNPVSLAGPQPKLRPPVQVANGRGSSAIAWFASEDGSQSLHVRRRDVGTGTWDDTVRFASEVLSEDPPRSSASMRAGTSPSRGRTSAGSSRGVSSLQMEHGGTNMCSKTESTTPHSSPLHRMDRRTWCGHRDSAKGH